MVPTVSFLTNGCEPDLWLGLPAALPPTITPRRDGKLIVAQAVTENGGPKALSSPAAKAWWGRSEASSIGNYLCDGASQERLWRDFFSDPKQWWDNRQNKGAPQHPDFRHKKTKEALWLNNSYKPDWVDTQLAMWDASSSETVSTSVQGGYCRVARYECDMRVGTCGKLCEDGMVSEAVDALNLLVQGGCRVPNNLFYRVLKKCVAQKDLVLGRRVHALTVTSGYESNAFLANHLICMYASHGSLVEAMQVFSQVPVPDVYMWASIILAYAKHGEPSGAIRLYQQMLESTVKPDNHIFVAVLKACATVGDLAVGQDVHAQVRASAVKPDIFVQSALVDMYAKCGSLEDARKAFDKLSCRDVVTWNAMIAGYAQEGMGQEALALYSIMQEEGITSPDSVTFVCLLQACARVAALSQGMQLHAQIEERGLQNDVFVGNSLVNMYAKCGSLRDAQRVFDRLSQRDVVTWTAMIAGYAQQGMGQEALSLYSSMQQEGITPPNSFTFACLLQACASVAALPLGKQLHAQIEEQGFHADVVVGPSLVNMYAKCGSLQDAWQVFDSLPEKGIVAWGAIIAGYARQGDSDIVFDLVERMRLEGIQPDSMTHLSVLTVCSHAGLVDKGRSYFQAMCTDYGITPTIEHYTCMTDLLARAGHLDEALWMVKTMPLQPDGAVWLTLLGACRKWGNVEVGREAFEFAVRLDEKDAAAYILMANIYVDSQMWEEANDMEAKRVISEAWKQPGRSWCTDIDGVQHSFVVGDRKHPEI